MPNQPPNPISTPISDNQVSESVRVPIELRGQRLDQVSAELFSGFSRAQLQQWIRDGKLTVNGQSVLKPKQRMAGSEQLDLNVELEAHGDDLPQDIPLDIVYQDTYLLVVNKPAGMVVHPGAGNRSGTLVNALLHHDPQLALQPRAGIVHRLDKDTSGALLVARQDSTRLQLSAMLKARDIHRYYQALVWGQPPTSGTIDLPLGRHPVDRVRMAVRPEDDHNARQAITHFKRRRKYPGLCLLDIKLETGRTHQIRVHLTHQGFPLVGDKTYVRKGMAQQAEVGLALREQLEQFPRQWLHAIRLQFEHPVTQQILDIDAQPPDELVGLLQQLDGDAKQ